MEARLLFLPWMFFKGIGQMLFLKGQLAVWIHFVCTEVTLFSRNERFRD